MNRSRTGRRAGAVALAALLALAGCQSGEQLIPVEGQVVVDGKPLAAGVVVYHPDKGKGNQSMHEPRGEVADGKYKLVTGSQTTGCPPGWYKVTVYAGVKINPKDPYSPEKFLTDKKYADPNTSGLAVEVKHDAPPGHYDLKLGK